MLEIDPPLVESWQDLLKEAQNDEERSQVLSSLAKHITLENYWLRKEIRAYVLRRMGEMDAEERIHVFRRNKVAELKKLDYIVMERRRSK